MTPHTISSHGQGLLKSETVANLEKYIAKEVGVCDLPSACGVSTDQSVVLRPAA